MPRRRPDDIPLSDLWNLTDIAEGLEVQYPTARSWKTRGVLPPPVARMGNMDLWDRLEILAWARAEKRGRYDRRR